MWALGNFLKQHNNEMSILELRKHKQITTLMNEYLNVKQNM